MGYTTGGRKISEYIYLTNNMDFEENPQIQTQLRNSQRQLLM